MDRKRIEDIIAEARAEEELLNQEVNTGDTDFREAIKKTLEENLKDRPKVTIDIEEYILLRQKDKDLERLLHTILDCLELDYLGKDLMIKDERKIKDTIKILYTAAYDAILEAELENAKEEGE